MPPEASPSETGMRCPKCGYNLTAITSNRCPECGEQFVITNVRGYLARFPPSQLRRICNVVWVVGTAAIILSWARVVPPSVGWVGFGVSVVAWALSSTIARR
jgi:ABC-type ATPase with predicted acetyltransferase domain